MAYRLDAFVSKEERKRGYAIIRAERLAAARAKGIHTKTEWQALSGLFGQCVYCGASYDDLYGGEPTKDHIEPIRFGGCDCIANLQPSCRNCNASGSRQGDKRNIVRPGWVKEFISLCEGGSV